ncbi:MAG: 3-oxoadipate enol-lactonase, partial [Acidimicrobiales bacterium]
MKAIVCTDEVSAGAVALRYRLDGPPGGPVVVLSNSLGCSAAMWESQVEALTPYRRVLRYEHRGHGGAPAPAGPYSIADLGGDLIGLLDALGIEKAALGGLSLGGMVGMWVASHHPDRVDRLALMCTSPHMPPPSTWAERAAAVRTGGTEILLEGSLGRWFTAGFPERRPDVADLVRSMLGVAKPEGYAGCCEAIVGMDQRESIRSISVPTAVLAGAEDPSTPPAVGLGIAEAVPGASLTVVAGAAHLATLEQPARVSSWLVDHLVGTPLQRGDAIRRAVLGDANV